MNKPLKNLAKSALVYSLLLASSACTQKSPSTESQPLPEKASEVVETVNKTADQWVAASKEVVKSGADKTTAMSHEFTEEVKEGYQSAKDFAQETKEITQEKVADMKIETKVVLQDAKSATQDTYKNAKEKAKDIINPYAKKQ